MIRSLGTLFGGALGVYRRNFLQLVIVYAVFMLVLFIPVFIYLPSIMDAIVQNLVFADAVAFYSIAYLLNSAAGLILKMMLFVCAIGLFWAPFAMGILGKIVSRGTQGERVRFANALRFACRRYRQLFASYALFYAVLGAYIVIAALTITHILDSSYIVIRNWLAPSAVLFAAGFVVLAFGTAFIPYCIIEERKHSATAFAASFKLAFGGGALRNLGEIAAGTAVTFAFFVGVFFAVGYAFSSGQGWLGLIVNLGGVWNDALLMLITCALLSLGAVFQYIYCYHVYLNASVRLGRRSVRVERTGGIV